MGGRGVRRLVLLAVALAALVGAAVALASEPAATTVSVYLVRGEKLGAAHRRVPHTAAVASAALRELLKGPTALERRAGLGTAVPAGTGLRGVRLASGTATVDLTRRFESGGGSLSMTLRVAQVVATLTQFPTVKRVRFLLDGRAVQAIGGEGVIVVPPRTRATIEGELPAILVESPAVGDRVGSPLRVSGSANVFEARFVVRVVARGKVLVERPVSATSGTGTRGTFTATLRFRVPAGVRTVTLVAFEPSAKDGRPINVVRVPLAVR